MKRNFIFILAMLTAVMGAALLNGSIKGKEDITLDELNKLERQFGENIYVSFYSLDELRSFAIIQLDKTSDNYNNCWLSPELTAKYLSAKEKGILKKAIADFIASSDNSKENLNKIKYWLAADGQFSAMAKGYGLSLDEIVKLLMSNPKTQYLLNEINPSGNIPISDLSEIEKNKLYHRSINVLCEMEVVNQFHYYASIFSSYANSIAKN